MGRAFRSLGGFEKPAPVSAGLLSVGQAVEVIVDCEFSLLHQVEQVWAEHKVGKKPVNQGMQANRCLTGIGMCRQFAFGNRGLKIGFNGLNAALNGFQVSVSDGNMSSTISALCITMSKPAVITDCHREAETAKAHRG